MTDTLLRWADENEQEAANLRIIAGTDPARYAPAMRSARHHERRAREYRASHAARHPDHTQED